MGLAIDGNEVHGIARGGQAFVSLGNAHNTDGSINIGGQDYLSKNWMRIKDTNYFDLGLSSDQLSGTTNVTSNLSNYEGDLAICVINLSSNSTFGTLSQPIIVPTTQGTVPLVFDMHSWSGSLSMDTGNNLTCTVSCSDADSVVAATGDFYVLTNN